MKQAVSHLCFLVALTLMLSVISVRVWAADEIVVHQESVVENFQEQDIGPSLTEAGNGKRDVLDIPVISWRDLPFQTVKRQALDYSCGSAAVSTLLTFVYGVDTSEGSVFKAMFEAGDKNKIRREGFSLLDMSTYLNNRGYKSAGYKIDLPSIEKKQVPFIALINNDGYNHFVVVKSIEGPYVLVGDPNKGNVIYTREAFTKIWNGISLVVTDHASVARAVFGDPTEWRFAHPLAMQAEADYPGIGSSALPPMQWQIAPASSDMLSAVTNVTSSLR